MKKSVVKANKDKLSESPPAEPAKPGRPPIDVDESLLERLAMRMLSDGTIAVCLGISEDTLHRRFAEKIDKIRGNFKAKLADVVIDEGINKRKDYAVKMLAQKHLGYADKTEVDHSGAMGLANLSDEELDKRIAEKLGKI